MTKTCGRNVTIFGSPDSAWRMQSEFVSGGAQRVDRLLDANDKTLQRLQAARMGLPPSLPVAVDINIDSGPSR